MVLKPGPGKNEEYTVRMLTENRIPGFLPFREKQVDGERWFYYDVTSRQPLGRILEHRNLRGKELERLAADLLFSLKQTERYLLDEKSMDLTPEMIYVDPDSFQCSFCLVPGGRWDFSQGFRELSQYLLDHVDHRDGEAVVLAFGPFSVSPEKRISDLRRSENVWKRPGQSQRLEKTVRLKKKRSPGTVQAGRPERRRKKGRIHGKWIQKTESGDLGNG